MSSEQMLAVITALPDFVSVEEHGNVVASTPSSFNDIHPVLRHKEEHVSITLDPPLAEFSPGDGADGVLYVIESALVFMSATGRGLQVKYPAITLHAISRAGGTTPSIYCQLQETVLSDEAEADEDETEMRELIIVPRNPASLEFIFEAMSVCASLHPEPNLSEEGDFISEDGFETFDAAEGEEELSEVGRAALAHLESIIYEPTAQVNGNMDGAEDVLSEQDETKE